MKFNRLIRTGDLDWLRKEAKLFSSAAGGLINADCIWKWGMIWRVANQLGLLRKENTFVDIGGGQAPLQYMFSNYVNILNVDTGVQRYLPPMDKRIPQNRENIYPIKADFLRWITKVDKESIDVFYDSCSFIHFGWKRTRERPKAIDKAMPHIVRALRPGGYFISVSDLCHPASTPYGDMVYPDTLAMLYDVEGLEFIDQPDWKLEPFFADVRNSHCSLGKKMTPWSRHTTDNCSDTCRDFPEYHILMSRCLGGQRGEIILIMGLFVLRKTGEENDNV